MKYLPTPYWASIFLLACSVSAAETWHADPISGCTVYDSEDPTAKVIVSWSGDCDRKNRASGNGVLTWVEDGKLAGRYAGPMNGGKANGVGVIYIVADGGFDRYEGVFKDGDINGPAQAIAADGITFSGVLNSADFSGEGIFTSANGDQYTGKFANGELNGRGHLVLANGEQYRGTFSDNEIEDGGEWLGTNGDYYKGDFQDGEFWGEGRYGAVDGSTYEGDWVAGLPEGQGRYTDATGRMTAGTFVAGWPDGQVDITTTDGVTLSEFWSDGELEVN